MTRPRRIDRAAAFASGHDDTANFREPGPGAMSLDKGLQPVAAVAAARLAFDRERSSCRIQVAQADCARFA